MGTEAETRQARSKEQEGIDKPEGRRVLAMGCAALVFCRQIILSPPTAIKGPFVFEADMHPENESTTLNKCNPQKV